MSDIPTELHLEILRRMPVESLFRFRSVCKEWRRIIDDPSFPNLHLRRGIGSSDWLIIRATIRKVYALSLSNLLNNSHSITTRPTTLSNSLSRLRLYSIPEASCYGLILNSSTKQVPWVISNPFRGERLKLPVCHDKRWRCFPGDPPDHGIGYDVVNDDYKVVKVVDPHTFVCSVNSATWHMIEDFPEVVTLERRGVYLNGALHWVGLSTDSGDDVVGWIIALDLTTETYRKLPLPLSITFETRCVETLELNALGGTLFLSSCHLTEYRYLVWMLTDYGGENTWVEMMPFGDKDSSLFSRLIAYLEPEKQLLIRYNHADFLWYDVERKSTRLVDILGIARTYIEDVTENFCSHAFPANIVRLKRDTVDDEIESTDSEGSSDSE